MESVCDLCGANHATSCCSLIKDAKAVPNNKTLSLARLSLPPELELVTMADGSETVKSKSTLSKNTMFGPFDAPSTRLLSPLITFPLKVFVSARTAKSTGFYYLDTTDEATSNWMRFVRGTVTGFQKWREQNLMCYQIDGNVFYIASRDILEGEELKVGYSPNYAKKMGLPATIGPKHGTTTQEVLAWMQTEAKAAAARAVSSLPDSALGVPDSKSCAAWRCQTCDRADFDSVAQYAAHLRLHYKAQKGADGGTRRRSVRTTNSQFDTLITFMTSHEEFARGRLTGTKGRAAQSALWAQLTALLNHDPTGPSKDAKSWAETWDNWKSKTRKKRAEKLKSERTGGSARKEIHFTDPEQKLLDFLESSATTGKEIGGVPEVGGLLAAYIASSRLSEESDGSVVADEEVAYLIEDHITYLEEVDVSVAEAPPPDADDSGAATPVPAPGKGKKRKSSAARCDAKKAKKKKKLATDSEHVEAFGGVDDRQADVLGEMATALTSIAASFVRIAAALENRS